MKQTFLLLFGLLSEAHSKEFKVYWNIPTFFCKKFGLHELNVTEYGIIQNHMDTFRGDEISILYDPGLFPAILQNANNLVLRNGGVPQEGNLSKHLELFIQNLNELMPDENNKGLAIIDFESWRPVFRQNFGVLQPYKDLSFRLIREKHWLWPKWRVEEEATKLFQEHALLFMKTTIELAKRLRPNAHWGYYGLPFCFNGKKTNFENCPSIVTSENNESQWLYDASNIIYPSAYVTEKVDFEDRSKIVRGKIKEALRLSKRVNFPAKPPVIAYHRYVFTDSNNFLTERDTYEVLNAIKSIEADGVVLWGSWNDLNSKDKCETFYGYLKNVLGPVVQSLK